MRFSTHALLALAGAVGMAQAPSNYFGFDLSGYPRERVSDILPAPRRRKRTGTDSSPRIHWKGRKARALSSTVAGRRKARRAQHRARMRNIRKHS
jgi:hypothetical protein